MSIDKKNNINYYSQCYSFLVIKFIYPLTYNYGPKVYGLLDVPLPPVTLMLAFSVKTGRNP